MCTELAGSVAQIIADSQQQLTDKGIAVVNKSNVLFAVLGDGETGQDFAEGLLGEYQADVAAGTFALVEIDFATPTETFPVECTGLATYDALSELVDDSLIFLAYSSFYLHENGASNI